MRSNSHDAQSLVLMAAIGFAGSALAAGDVYEERAYREAAACPPEERAPLSLYDRISRHYAPMGREVREEYRDGPCRVERHWETDGDYEETIKCRGPRD